MVKDATPLEAGVEKEMPVIQQTFTKQFTANKKAEEKAHKGFDY